MSLPFGQAVEPAQAVPIVSCQFAGVKRTDALVALSVFSRTAAISRPP
jgi:hypothetical protein